MGLLEIGKFDSVDSISGVDKPRPIPCEKFFVYATICPIHNALYIQAGTYIGAHFSELTTFLIRESLETKECQLRSIPSGTPIAVTWITKEVGIVTKVHYLGMEVGGLWI